MRSQSEVMVDPQLCSSITHETCTYVVLLRLETPFDSIASQFDDVTRLQAAIPAEAHAVP